MDLNSRNGVERMWKSQHESLTILQTRKKDVQLPVTFWITCFVSEHRYGFYKAWHDKNEGSRTVAQQFVCV